ncbi:MAG: hypothetical protein V7604_2191, partial [Hyphomicrobiales bacterium]|jgi:hypothetical protein
VVSNVLVSRSMEIMLFKIRPASPDPF